MALKEETPVDATVLVATLADPDRAFEALAIGLSERDLYRRQLAGMAPLFAHYRVTIRLPELGGEVDPEIAAHDELMVLLGVISKREVVRTPDGGTDVDDCPSPRPGPLPRRAAAVRLPARRRRAAPEPRLARRGARAQRLDIDPTNGPVVAWMFQQCLVGHSMARITRALNDMKIPCPAAADRERNPHRTAEAWTLTSVHAVLHNPATPVARCGTGSAPTTN